MATSTSTPGTERKPRREFNRLALTLALIASGCAAPVRGTIGAVLLRKPDGRVYLRDVPEHLAAAKAGLRPGDELLLVEGQDVRRLSDEDLQRVLSGNVDEPVKLTLSRGDEVLRVTVRRSMAEPYRVE